MRINASTRYATLAALVGALACASNTARTDETAAAKDTTTTTRDTLNQNENPPGYRGMERDTTQAPTGQTPSDTFLQNQGAGTPQDTAGYSGIERDTTTQPTSQPSQTDTSSMRSDTTGAGGVTDTSKTGGAADTSGYNPNSANPSSGTALDSTGKSTTGDTTGYNQSQQQRDSTSR
jgi:hypothetical protein